MVMPALNDVGQLHFLASLTDTTGGTTDNQALYRGDINGVVEIARRGQSAPNGDGIFGQFTSHSSIDNTGNVLFEARIDGSASGGTEWGLFHGSGGTITRVARTGQNSPDGNGQFNSFGETTRNSSGDIAFTASLLNTSGTNDFNGLFMTSGNSLVSVVRTGDLAPDGNGLYQLINDPDISDNGLVAFRAQFSDTIQGIEDRSGIFSSDGTTTNTVVRRGDTSPDGDGEFSFFASSPRINSSGQISIVATLIATASGDPESILMRAEANGNLTVIARSGDAAPDGNGEFNIAVGASAFNSPAINDAGQLVFETRLTNTSGGSSDDYGLYYFDDLIGLKKVVREGDAYLGSVITNISFEEGTAAHSRDRNGFNESGLVTYRFFLADGRSGIGVFNPVPEPSSAIIVALAMFGLTHRRRMA